VLFKSCNVEIVQDAGRVFNSWRYHKHARKRESRCRQEAAIYIVEFHGFVSYPEFLLVNKHKTPQPSTCTTTGNLMNKLVRDAI